MPSFINRSLRKYEDKYFTSGIGMVSFSIHYHDFMAISRVSEAEIEGTIRQSATDLAYRISTNAPVKTGDLRKGIIPSPLAEKTKAPGKVVFDVVFDAGMNDKFVKMSKSGKRYYYPASQEYGFRIGRVRRHPGLYYMRDTAVIFYPEHENRVADSVEKILEEL